MCCVPVLSSRPAQYAAVDRFVGRDEPKHRSAKTVRIQRLHRAARVWPGLELATKTDASLARARRLLGRRAATKFRTCLTLRISALTPSGW
jgi:hypothetical protein